MGLSEICNTALDQVKVMLSKIGRQTFKTITTCCLHIILNSPHVCWIGAETKEQLGACTDSHLVREKN